MKANKLKSSILSLIGAAALSIASAPASAQLPIAIPIGSFGLDSLGAFGDLGAGLPELGGLPMGGAGGGIPGLEAIGGAAGSAGVPPFLIGLFTGGADNFMALGTDIFGDIIGGGGIAEIPLIGLDLANFTTPDGFVSGLQGLGTDYTLPIGIPVLERSPAQLYFPVIFSALATQGLPVGNGAPPLPAEILTGDFGGFGIGGLGAGGFNGGIPGLDGVLAILTTPSLPFAIPALPLP